MSTLHSSAPHSHQPRTRFEKAWLALGVLVAIAVAVIMLTPSGTHRHVRAPSPAVPATQHHGIAASHVVFDPLTGHMHGGVTPTLVRAGGDTVAPRAAAGYVRAEHSYGAVP